MFKKRQTNDQMINHAVSSWPDQMDAAEFTRHIRMLLTDMRQRLNLTYLDGRLNKYARNINYPGWYDHLGGGMKLLLHDQVNITGITLGGYDIWLLNGMARISAKGEELSDTYLRFTRSLAILQSLNEQLKVVLAKMMNPGSPDHFQYAECKERQRSINEKIDSLKTILSILEPNNKEWIVNDSDQAGH